MKKAFIILLCALAVFAIVSCKEEPAAPVKDPVVTFNTLEGSEIAPVTVKKGVAVEKPEDPTKDGAYFYTWFTDAEFENEYDFATPVTKSITLFAKWIEIPAKLENCIRITAGRASDRFQYQWIFGENGVLPGDVISFKYKSNRTLDKTTTRGMSAADSAIKKFVDGVALTSEPDAEGWYTYTFTVPAAYEDSTEFVSANGIAVALLISGGNSVVGEDYICIKGITYTRGEDVKKLTIALENVYSGANNGPVVDNEYIYRLEATDGTDGVDDEKYSRDKFRLKFTGSPTVQENDVFSITFKTQRTDELTEGRDFAKYNIRDKGKWIYETGAETWTSFATDEATGWTTATFKFGATYYDGSAVTYPATFYVDLIDTKMASPKEGRIPDVLYIKSITLTSGEVTTELTLDEEATSSGYVCPIIEKF